MTIAGGPRPVRDIKQRCHCFSLMGSTMHLYRRKVRARHLAIVRRHLANLTRLRVIEAYANNLIGRGWDAIRGHP